MSQRIEHRGHEERRSTAETQRKPEERFFGAPMNARADDIVASWGAASSAPTKSIVQRLLDFGFGDGAFADYVPVVAVEADDGAGQDAAGVACVQD